MADKPGASHRVPITEEFRIEARKKLLIAMARKVIVLDFKELEPMMALGIATLIAALAARYYLMKRAGAVPRSSLLD